MAKHAKPRIHGRDHEHGGADATLIHYADVGTGIAPPGTGGIQFGANTGTWLQINTSSATPGGSGVQFVASGVTTTLLASGSATGVDSTGSSVGVKGTGGSSGVIGSSSSGHGIDALTTSGIALYAHCGTGGMGVEIDVPSGSTALIIYLAGAPVLKVDASGLHLHAAPIIDL